MRYVSRSSNYMLIARNEQEHEIFEQVGGNLIPKTLAKPILVCQFRHGIVQPDEAYAAMLHWSGMPSTRTDPDRVDASGHGVPDVFGATPYQRSVPLRDGVGRITAVSEASRPEYTFSMFDTEWITDEIDRKDAEEALATNADNNIWYVKVEKAQIPAPWPGYEKMRATRGKTIEMAIMEMIDVGGYDPNFVMAYEKAHKDRKPVIDAIEKLLSDVAEAEAEKKSMTVTVS